MSVPVASPGLDLFALLPAIHRVRDIQLAQSLTLLTDAERAMLAQLQALSAPGLPALASDQVALLGELASKAQRGPLQSLLLVLQEQIEIIANDIEQLYDDQFIETCASWVIPYIGDLIGYRAVAGIAPSVDNPRAEVAGTIAMRRRKGTVQVMEELARDATGWGAHALEFFRVLADTQYMNHLRPGNVYSPDLRLWQPGLYMDTGFDRTAHKVDVRRIDSGQPRSRGRHDIQNIGIFLWSLGAWSVTRSPLTPDGGAPGRFRVSTLGMDIPLYHQAVAPAPDTDDPLVEQPSRPVNVADRLLRRALCADVQRGVGARWYGPEGSLVIHVNGTPLDPYQVRVCRLSDAQGAWVNTAVQSPYAAAIDPETGRVALPVAGALAPVVTVSYRYGFNADLGGGEYGRATGKPGFVVDDPAWVVPYPDTSGTLGYNSLPGAIAYAVGLLSANGAVAVELAGSQIVSLAGPLAVDLPEGTTLELRAADGARPTLLLAGEIVVTGAAGSTVILNGLLVAAASGAAPPPTSLVHAPGVRSGGSVSRLEHLQLTHCTLVPGGAVDAQGRPAYPAAPALIAEAAGLQVAAARCVLGAVHADRVVAFSAVDSIIDATAPTGVAYAAPAGSPHGTAGGALTLVGCTVVGKVHATVFALVSDSIVWAWRDPADVATWDSALIADRHQSGCVRFSYLPAGAITPRRFACVEKSLDNPQPLFLALRYGLPGYCKLLASTDDRIRRGADDGGEMGVFHYLLSPLRETDLRIRLQEYLPAGMAFGLIHQN